MSGGDPLVAGVELGGTKAIALIARGAEIVDQHTVPTEAPARTLTDLADWLAARPGFVALGIGSFGPLDLDLSSTGFGRITSTPKPGWVDTDVRGHFAARFPVPVGFDTDVAGAALAEARWGAAQGCDVHVYVTIGTGIGAGVVANGAPVHGLVHPELGHLRLRRRPDDRFSGVCPYHGDCLEGLASGPAIAARAGARGETLPLDHPVWNDVADSLAEFAATLILALSPQRIVFGGGVPVGQPMLLPRVRERVLPLLGGYVAGLDAERLAELIRPPALGAQAGPLGAAALAYGALASAGQSA